MIYKFREIWKTVVIDGVEHPRYQVSNLGRVKCLNWGGYGKPRLCRLSEVTNGYLKVSVDRVLKFVHRIVAETFIPNPEGKPCVDHVDTNRQNNCVWNLKWTTQKENCSNPLSVSHYIENVWSLKYARGKHVQSIIQLKLDGEFVKKWACGADASRELGICHCNITNCCRGRHKSAGGFRWMYYYDWFKTRRKKSLKDIKPLFV